MTVDAGGKLIAGTFPSIPFDQRFRGYTFTVETSPDPLGLVDQPDDGDWTGSAEFKMFPNYPNPFRPITSLRFELQTAAHVTIELRATPWRVLRTVLDDDFTAGVWEVTCSDSLLSPGLYRLTGVAKNGSSVLIDHGDIVVQ